MAEPSTSSAGCSADAGGAPGGRIEPAAGTRTVMLPQLSPGGATVGGGATVRGGATAGGGAVSFGGITAVLGGGITMALGGGGTGRNGTPRAVAVGGAASVAGTARSGVQPEGPWAGVAPSRSSDRCGYGDHEGGEVRSTGGRLCGERAGGAVRSAGNPPGSPLPGSARGAPGRVRVGRRVTSALLGDCGSVRRRPSREIGRASPPPAPAESGPADRNEMSRPSRSAPAGSAGDAVSSSSRFPP